MKLFTFLIAELPPPPPPSVSSSVEEEDMNALIENLVTEALEASGPGVEEDWDFDFDEKEWLWTLSPATTSAAAESAKEEAQAHIGKLHIIGFLHTEGTI